jgi:hypothetical protein
VSTNLLKDIRILIDAAQKRVAHTVNAEIVLLYWHIAARIQHDVLRQARAGHSRVEEWTCKTTEDDTIWAASF